MPSNNEMDDALPPEMIARAEQAAAALDAYAVRTAQMAACGLDCRVEEAYRLALKERFDRLLSTFGRQRRRA